VTIFSPSQSGRQHPEQLDSVFNAQAGQPVRQPAHALCSKPGTYNVTANSRLQHEIMVSARTGRRHINGGVTADAAATTRWSTSWRGVTPGHHAE